MRWRTAHVATKRDGALKVVEQRRLGFQADDDPLNPRSFDTRFLAELSPRFLDNRKGRLREQRPSG